MPKKKVDEVIRRNRAEYPYTNILNEMLQNDDLNWHQKGMMAELWSKSDDWVIYKSWLMKRSELGRDRFNRDWNDLQAKGYITKERVRNDKGQFTETIWTLHEVPVEVVDESVKEVAQDNAKSEKVQEESNSELQAAAEGALEATFDTIDSLDNLSVEEAEVIKEELVQEVMRIYDVDWVISSFGEAWSETLVNLKRREHLTDYLINNMQNRLSKKLLLEARANAEVYELSHRKVPNIDIPMDGPWNV